MWVTQTYLGSVEEDADVFVYYLYEDYNQEQLRFTGEVQRALEDMGDTYRDTVSLQMPNPRYAGRIEAEVRENKELWGEIRGRLPGLLIATAPFARLKWPNHECYYLPFNGRSEEAVAEAITAARLLTNSSLQSMTQSRDSGGFGSRLRDSLELKPGIYGIRLDLKRLFGAAR